jgi:hypothetical protein
MTSIRRELQAAAGVSTGEADPEATDFDGQTNYLERTSELSNVSDAKTFTLSFFIYPSPMWHTTTDGGANQSFFWCGTATTTSRSFMRYDTSSSVSGNMKFYLRQSSGTDALVLTINVPVATWTNVLVSVDLANASNRYVYLNDVDVSTNTDIVDWDTYTDANIDWTVDYTRFGKMHSTQQWFQGRLSHFFLDMTYRDLSSSVNRRHFIDADGFPADPSSLSPPLYMAFTDASAAATNSGTGGNYTAYGTFNESARGPNQYNCVASDWGTSGDYANTTSFSTSTTTVVTGSFIYSAAGSTGESYLMHNPNGGNWVLGQMGSGTTLSLNFEGGGQVYYVIPLGRFGIYHVAYCFDSASSGNCKVFVNGTDLTSTATTSTVSGGNIGGFDDTYGARLEISNDGSFAIFGEGWIEKTYRALATDNIFWDSDNSRPKPVAQVIEDAGVTPLGGYPVYAPNPGKNLGSSGGNLTEYSLPWRGSVSMSEYIGRTINNTSGATTVPIMRYSSALTGVSDGKTWSMAFSFFPEVDESGKTILAIGPNDYQRVWVSVSKSKAVEIETQNSSDTKIGDAEASVSVDLDEWHNVLICWDQASSSNCKIYLDGISQTVTVSTLTDENINMSTTGGCSLGGFIESSTADGNNFKGHYGNIFWTTEYIDFGTEANRLKFYSALQMPVDCGSDGTTPTGTAPAIYMRNGVNAYGTNAGTGGNFTTPGSGTVVEGLAIGSVPVGLP